MYKASGKRTTVYFNDEDAKLIEDYAKKNNLSFSKAVVQLSLAGFENKGGKSSEIETLKQQINQINQDFTDKHQKQKKEILTLKKKLQNLTEMMAASRLGDLRDKFIWEESNPPLQQIPIHLWYDASNPNYKEKERYGLTQQELLFKMFGVDGDRLFHKWCLHLNLKKNEAPEKIRQYLEKISGAKLQQVKSPHQTNKTYRYVINHLFTQDHSYLFQEPSSN
ncbi:hypothetical protein FRE64_17280 (plasmid) [Euhalothece natronophila Z-M001]|uniref:Uncharacterized protein n=1 Tax=Euhalothece natronophila Z-M001 TaxID=522448 RepID=A0A5B8NQW7_9CHRO|nr:hypothetical protein [Euhalothece natronophila]QDZ41713.1 hypothetical protein FRE64_17280 [Euhalothece natronophila Z-M001]